MQFLSVPGAIMNNDSRSLAMPRAMVNSDSPLEEDVGILEAERQLVADLRGSLASLQMDQEKLVERFMMRLRQQLVHVEKDSPGVATKMKRVQSPSLEEVETIEIPRLCGTSETPDAKALSSKFSLEYHSTKTSAALRAQEDKCSYQKSTRAIRLGTAGRLKRIIWEFYYYLENLQEPRRRGPLARIVCSSHFEVVTLFMVLFNGFLVVYQANKNAIVAADNPAELRDISSWNYQWVYLLESLLSGYFTIEIVLRLAVHRFYFFCNSDWCWNLFDFMIIAVTIPEIVITLVSGSENGLDMNQLRTLRVFRMTRSLRILRALHFVQHLRRLMECIASSIAEVFWCIVLIIFITGIFGTFLCQCVTAFLLDQDPQQSAGEDSAGLLEHFGSVPRAMFSLFKATSGGDDWGSYFDSLAQSGVIAPVIFVIYILFFLIAAWNIVTSLFIEKALAMAQPDMQQQLLSKRRQADADSKLLVKLMMGVDADGSGTISLDEFQRISFLPNVEAFFESRNIDVKDAEMVFHMLQTATGSNEIEIQTVVNGLMHLRGAAMNIDLQTLGFQLACMKEAFQTTLESIRKEISGLASLVSFAEEHREADRSAGYSL